MRLGRGIRGWAERRPLLFALGVYLAATFAFFVRPVASAPRVTCICFGGDNPDPTIFMWGLAWWPRAPGFGDLLVSREIFFPQGAELAQVTTVPFPALVLAPLTAVAGPILSYNVAIALAPVLAAFCAFLLCRSVTRHFWAALAGGYVFGFSAYVLAQMTGHLNLALVFHVPLLAYLVVRRVQDDLGPRAFIALAAAVVVAQLGTSTEVAMTTAVFGAATVLIALRAAPEPALRSRIAGAARLLAGAYVVAALVTAPYIASALGGGGPEAMRDSPLRLDLAGFVIPTQLAEFGGGAFSNFGPLEFRFRSWGEDGGYLGLPLIAILVAFAVGTWRTWSTRLLVGTAAVAVVAAFGSRLTVLGQATIPMPWALADDLPVLNGAIPIRFVVYAWLAAAVMLALWLARPRVRSRWAWALAIVAALALVPNIGQTYWYKRMDIPPFFGTDAWKRELRPDDVVLVLPHKFTGKAMLWQAWTGIGFTMAGGYFGENWRDPDAGEPIFPVFQDTRHPTGDHTLDHLREYLRRRRVTVVAVEGTEYAAGAWPTFLTRIGWVGRSDGGMLLFRPRSRL